MQEMQVRSLGQEDPLEKEMATRSSILAWKIPWTEEPGGLQSMGSQKVRHIWGTEQAGTLTSLSGDSDPPGVPYVVVQYSPKSFLGVHCHAEWSKGKFPEGSTHQPLRSTLVAWNSKPKFHGHSWAIYFYCFSPGFLSLNTNHILHWAILCWGRGGGLCYAL